MLDRIPDDASVTATTFLVVPLSRRAVLYDLRYCSQEHLLSTDYVVVETTDSGSLKPYAVDGEDGLEGLTALLRAAGYAQLPEAGQEAAQNETERKKDRGGRAGAGAGCRRDGGLQDRPDASHDGQGTHGLRGLHHFVPGGSPRG